jgi:hypothetical protein
MHPKSQRYLNQMIFNKEFRHLKVDHSRQGVFSAKSGGDQVTGQVGYHPVTSIR